MNCKQRNPLPVIVSISLLNDNETFEIFDNKKIFKKVIDESNNFAKYLGDSIAEALESYNRFKKDLLEKSIYEWHDIVDCISNNCIDLYIQTDYDDNLCTFWIDDIDIYDNKTTLSSSNTLSNNEYVLNKIIDNISSKCDYGEEIDKIIFINIAVIMKDCPLAFFNFED